MLSGESRLFPIIGDPVIYAQSPERLTRSFVERGYNAVCVPMQVPEGALRGVMEGLSQIPNIDGLLVTMPHKFAAYSYCTTSSETSRLLKAVSVMRRNADSSWHGDVLDGLAFVKAQKDAGAEPEGARVLLIGAGGAGSAIAIALLTSGVRELVVHDRNQTRCSAPGIVARRLSGPSGPGRPIPAGFNMVCNATPMGMSDGDSLPIDTELLEFSLEMSLPATGRHLSCAERVQRAAGQPVAIRWSKRSRK